MKTKTASEQDIKQLITDYCDAHGIFWRRRNVKGATRVKGGHWIMLGRKGESDLWGIHHGVHWECEVKRPGEEPSIPQMTWLNLCTSYGARAFWCDSLESFIEQMEGL